MHTHTHTTSLVVPAEDIGRVTIAAEWALGGKGVGGRQRVCVDGWVGGWTGGGGGGEAGREDLGATGGGVPRTLGVKRSGRSMVFAMPTTTTRAYRMRAHSNRLYSTWQLEPSPTRHTHG